MGMYTRLTFWAEIPDAHADEVKSLVSMRPESRRPDHPFFKTPRYGVLFSCSSYYFNTGRSRLERDDIIKGYWLNIDSSLKNYDDEIELFLDWIHPLVKPGNFQHVGGFTQYEEDERPTLIYYEDDGFKLVPA